MNTSIINRCATVLCGVGFLLACGPADGQGRALPYQQGGPYPPPGQVQSATVLLDGIQPGQTDQALQQTGSSFLDPFAEGGDLAAKDSVGEGLDQISQLSRKEVEETTAGRRKVEDTKPRTPAQAQRQKEVLTDGKQHIDHQSKIGKFMDGLKKVADMVNIVAVGAKSMGYAVEGDMVGAVSVVVDELSKKAATAISSTAGGTILPGPGNVVGAEGGEQFHAKYIRPVIQQVEDAVRVEDAKKRMLGDGTPQTVYWDEKGRIKTLPQGMYIDPETRNIQQRTPEEQAAYRREHQQKRKEELARQEERKEDDVIDDLVKRAEEARKQKEAEEKARQQEESRTTAPILDKVTPVKVTAMREEEVGDDRLVVRVTFWNVGDLAPGYGEATLTAGDQEDQESTTGRFSGGPNGTFLIKGSSFALVGGTHIDYEGWRIPVLNPDAFRNWPKGF